MNITDEARGRDRMLAALSAYGANLERWPDLDLAEAARPALLADRALRGEYDAEAALDRRLDALKAKCDAGLEAGGGVGRIEAAVIARLPPRRRRPERWIAAAATMVLAAGLGTITGLSTMQMEMEQRTELTMLDPL